MNRRAFLVFSATAAACAACAGCPDAAFALAKDEEKSIDLGLLSELPDQAVVEEWSKNGFFLIRREKKLYALSSQCTHKRVRLTLKGAVREILATEMLDGVEERAGERQRLRDDR